MTFYGQEKVEYNAQLCLMNMAVHGLTGVIKSGDEANTFYHDAHNLQGCCDYVMANPPFNVDKVKAESCASAGRLPFGLPSVNKNKEVGNANYLWISYFYAYLNERGRAGFVMASSATDSQNRDKDIREKLVRTGDVDVMISVGNNFFYTKSLPCSLWFFDRAKTEATKNRVLFIDARNYYTVVDRTLNEWSEWQLKNLNAIVWLYRGETEKYRALVLEYLRYFRGLSEALIGKQAKRVFSAIDGVEDFEDMKEALLSEIEAEKQDCKEKLEKAEKKDRKHIQALSDQYIEMLQRYLTVLNEALWLTDKFGEGEYRDVPGLCKVAYTTKEAQGQAEGVSVEERGWSLTPGAYVGVAPTADDGVDFAARMREIHAELLSLQAQSNALMDTISKNMEEMGL